METDGCLVPEQKLTASPDLSEVESRDEVIMVIAYGEANRELWRDRCVRHRFALDKLATISYIRT